MIETHTSALLHFDCRNDIKLSELFAKAGRLIGRLVHQEQQTHLANELAMAHMNKGNALLNLTRLAEALAEYDKAIAIYERLVHKEQQTHLANDLAKAYMNKALALESQSAFDEALACYEKSQQGWTFCVEHLNMFWVVPNLLKTLRLLLMTLLQLQLWPTAAEDILRFRALFIDYIEREGIDEGLKEAALNEMDKMISELRALSSEQRELLYGELGADGESVRSLIDKAEGSQRLN
jgi:tetratricopeptide (TPR) repeat protein